MCMYMLFLPILIGWYLYITVGTFGVGMLTWCILLLAYMHAYLHTYLRTYMPPYTPTYLLTDIRTDIRTDIHTCIPTCMPTYTHHRCSSRESSADERLPHMSRKALIAAYYIDRRGALPCTIGFIVSYFGLRSAAVYGSYDDSSRGTTGSVMVLVAYLRDAI